MFVAPKEGTHKVAVTFTLIDQTKELPQHLIRSFEAAATVDGWGYPTFLSRDSLRARPGYLTGNTFVIRARVRVLA